MRHKIFWMTFWITMALWFGHVWADVGDTPASPNGIAVGATAEATITTLSAAETKPAETEPAEIEPPPPAVAEEPIDKVEPAAKLPDASEASAPAAQEPIVTVEPDAQEPSPPAVVQEPIVDVEEFVDEAPQVTNVATEVPQIAWDRSNWPVTLFRPASGTTVHQPVYFEDFSPAAPVADGPSRVLAALGDPTADVYSAANTADLFMQPAKFCADLVLLPVKAAITWPSKPTTTP